MTRSLRAKRDESRERAEIIAGMPWYVRLFVDRSPAGFNAGDANLYRYVGNDPTNATDPTGLILAVTKLVTTAATLEYGKEHPILSAISSGSCTNGALLEGEGVGFEVEKRVAPYAIKLAVEKALKELGITGVKIELGNWAKANLSDDDYNKIKTRAGAKLETAFTICEPTVHRLVRRVVLPPPYPRVECLR